MHDPTYLSLQPPGFRRREERSRARLMPYGGGSKTKTGTRATGKKKPSTEVHQQRSIGENPHRRSSPLHCSSLRKLSPVHV